MNKLIPPLAFLALVVGQIAIIWDLHNLKMRMAAAIRNLTTDNWMLREQIKKLGEKKDDIC